MEAVTALPIWDVHAHYLPKQAVPLMGHGDVVLALEEVGGKPDSITLNGMPTGATIDQLSSVDGIVAQTDAMGIDRRVLSPPPFTYRYWDDPRDGLRLCRLLNDAHAQVVADHPDRFAALCTVPLQDPAAAVTEFQRATTELGLIGVTVGTNVAGRNLSDPDLFRFFTAVAESGSPVLVHPDFVPNPRLGDYYLLNLVGMPTETAISLSNLILSGTLQRLPDLRVCFVHGGGSAPYLMGRWTRGWHVRAETPRDTDRPPTDYLDHVFYDSLTHSAQALAYLVTVMGADHVVIGTDRPFDVEDPDPLASLARAPGLTEQQRATIQRVTPHHWLHGTMPP